MVNEILQRLNSRIFGRSREAIARARTTRALSGGRVSMQDPLRTQTTLYTAPPERTRSVWQHKSWTEEELLSLPVDQFMKLITSISPEVSKAYKDFLRHGNEAWYYQVEPRSHTPVIDNFFMRLKEKHHDPDVLIDRVFAGIFKAGAVFWELILNETADMAMDVAVMDPYTARYNWVVDEVVGGEWQLGQWQQGKWKDLHEDPTVMYIPFNAAPNEPYGRSIMESAPLDVVRMIGVMNDFRRVLESQGWARPDFSVDTEKLQAFMPPDVQNDVDAQDEFITNFLNGVNSMYSNLKPNEGYGHLDIVTVNMPKGGQMNASFFGLVDGLMRLYDRRVGRATGSTPIKQHSNESVAETHAKEQRKDYRIDISSIQSTVGGAFATLLGYVLRAEGKQGQVMFNFDNTPDPEDVKQYEEAESAKLDNLKKLKELADTGTIDTATYQLSLNQYKAKVESAHSAGARSFAVIEDLEHRCDDLDCLTCAEYDDLGIRDVQISPDGSEEPLPAVPAEFIVTSVILASAIEVFESEFKDYKNLLNARVTGMTMTDAIDTVRKGDWTWNQLTKRYHNIKTKITINQMAKLELRNDFIDVQRGSFDDLVDDLGQARISVQEWVLEMRKRVRNINAAQYMLAKGGRNAMFSEDIDALTDIILNQYKYLQQFGEDVRRGKLSLKQIKARSELYMESSTAAHERGKAASFGIELPEYPGDGNQICKARCRCRWKINDSGNNTKAYWTLNPAAQHCKSCLRNAEKWAPYTIEES